MHVEHPLTKMVVHLHMFKSKVEVDHSLFEGEVPMSQEQRDYYKQLIGDGRASVTVSRELSESSYGNGGKVFVSITLTVDQSQAGLEAGTAWAGALAEKSAWDSHAQLHQQLVQKGIIQP